MNPNPQFVNAVGYQSKNCHPNSVDRNFHLLLDSFNFDFLTVIAVPGGMYYMPAPPPPDHFLGPTYFAPPPVGMFMQGPVPDPTALQSSLVKQIEYYFRFGELNNFWLSE